MRFLLILIAAAVTGCGESAAPPPAADDDMHTAADELQESIETSLDKARGVEDELQRAADKRDAAIDDASGEH